MGSLSKAAHGGYRIQMVCGDGNRRAVRFGSVNKETAESIRLRVEHLSALAAAKLPMDTETAQWIGSIVDELAAKLAAVGLIPPSESQKLGELLTAYLERRKADSAPGTVVTIARVLHDLTRFYTVPMPTFAASPNAVPKSSAPTTRRDPGSSHPRLSHGD